MSFRGGTTQPNPNGAGRMNPYVCRECGGVTVTVHRENPPGVTPFMIGCLATPGCDGDALSQFYPREIPKTAHKAHLEWFRPSSKAEAEKECRALYPECWEAMLEHWKMGGSLSREPTP